MQEHPIPQDITGYRFHIVGSMTLKQFGEVFLGVVIAVIIHKTNLTGIVKWPLILLSVGIGAAAAFLPIEERPLDHWFTTFFKVMYKPTKFFWEKSAKIPDAFLYKSLASTIIQEPDLDLTPAKRQRIKEYLGSIPENNSFSTDLSNNELSRIKEIMSSFDSVVVTHTQTTSSVKPRRNKPNLDVRIRSMRQPQNLEDVVSTTVFDSNDNNHDLSLDHENKILKSSKKNSGQKSSKSTLSSDQVAQNIQIPKIKSVRFSSEKEVIEGVNNDSSSDLSQKTFIENVAPDATGVNSSKDVSFNSGLPFPIKPTKPNKLVGMVLSQNNDLLTGSIIEVQTIDGHIERAVKTNALGQFFITTPLKGGDYNIVVEKDGYAFQPLHVKIDGTIIQPIEIRSEN